VIRVWIDQDLCTGDGLCNDHSVEVFRLQEDGISYVRNVATCEVHTDPGGRTDSVQVPARLERTVIEAATVCPGECIFTEEDAAHEQ
jgi:ferredoxin